MPGDELLVLDRASAGCVDLPVSCTAAICLADPHCCQQSWDNACIAEIAPVCGYNCL